MTCSRRLDQGVLMMLLPLACVDAPAIGSGDTVPGQAGSSPECDSCEVILIPDTKIGDADGPGYVSEQATLARSSDGRFLLVSNFEPGTIKVFAPSGDFLGIVGRPGRGPGEYQSPSLIVPGDSLITIFDDVTTNITRLSTDLDHIETRTLGVRPIEAIRVSEDLYVVSTAPRPSSTGPVLRVYNWSADRLTGLQAPSLGDSVDVANAGRLLASGHDGYVWASEIDRYRVEKWDLRTGNLVGQVERSVDWFPPDQAPTGSAARNPPRTRVRDLVIGSNGALWVLIQTSSSSWRPVEPVQAPEGGSYISESQKNLLYDSIIEVLDPETGRLLGTGRFFGLILGFVGPERVFRYTEDATGNPSYEVLRLSLGAT